MGNITYNLTNTSLVCTSVPSDSTTYYRQILSNTINEEQLKNNSVTIGKIFCAVIIPKRGYKFVDTSKITVTAVYRSSTRKTTTKNIALKDIPGEYFNSTYFTPLDWGFAWNSPDVAVITITTDDIPSNAQSITSITITEESGACISTSENLHITQGFGDNDYFTLGTKKTTTGEITPIVNNTIDFTDLIGAISYLSLVKNASTEYNFTTSSEVSASRTFQYLMLYENSNGNIILSPKSGYTPPNDRISLDTSPSANTNISLTINYKTGFLTGIETGAPITYSLTNCTVNPQPTIYTDGDLSLAFTPGTGYEFITQPTLTAYGLSDGSEVSETITAVSGALLYSKNTAWDSVTSLEVSATAVAMCPITYTIANADVSPMPLYYHEGEPLTFTIEATNGKVFANTPSFVVTGTKNGAAASETIEAVESNGTYTIRFNTMGEWTAMQSMSLTAQAGAGCAITYSLTNASVTPRQSVWIEGTIINMIFTPNTGYYFYDAPTVQVTGNVNGSHQTNYPLQVYIDSDDGLYHCDLGRIYTLTDITAINVTASARAITPVQETYGVISLYKVTREILTQVSNRRFIRSSGGDLSYIDLGRFISSLRQYPCAIETTTPKEIKLGGYSLEINADEIPEGIIETELYDDLVSGLYSNSFDKRHARIELHLPYVGIYTINGDYINTTIKIVYRISLLSGDCIVKVFSNDKLIAEPAGSIGMEIPYIFYDTQGGRTLQGAYTDELKNIEPKIVVYETPYANDDGIFTTCKHDVMGNETGYFRARDFKIDNPNITERERTTLNTLITGGVWI